MMLKTITRKPGEPLTLENFFNPLFAEYPEAKDNFCDWIDRTKSAQGWAVILDPASKKFHTLPLSFQVGVLLEFMDEVLDARESVMTELEMSNSIIEGIIVTFVQEIGWLHYAEAEAERAMQNAINSQKPQLNPEP
jgi:hypothetical protein